MKRLLLVVVVAIAIGWWRWPHPVVVTVAAIPKVAPVAPVGPVGPVVAQPALPVAEQLVNVPPVAEPAGIGLGAKPEALRAIPAGRYRVTRTGGFAVVNLAGGDAITKPYGADRGGADRGGADRGGADRGGASRTIIGHVVDRANHPVANAIVLFDRMFTVHAGEILTPAAATTDETGAFTADHVPTGPCVAIALAQTGDWSTIVDVGDREVALALTGHGAIAGKLTVDDHGDSFALDLSAPHFTVRHETSPDGTYTIASVPPGHYTLAATLAHPFGTTAGESRERRITVTAGGTTQLDLAFSTGATVTAIAHPPKGSAGMTYWLFAGVAPTSAADARARSAAEHPRALSFGGMGVEPARFEDVSAGIYAACAAVFDPKTMEAADGPFGCVAVTVAADDTLRELAIEMN